MTRQLYTLESFLREAMEKGAAVRLVPVKARKTDGVEFYAHLMGVDGGTVDYAVQRDILTPLNRSAGG